MDADTINNEHSSVQEVNAADPDSGSNNIDSLEVLSSSGFIMQEIYNAMESLTRIELNLACTSEKLVNLNILIMHVATRENDFEAFALEKEHIFGDNAMRALEFDLLSGILDAELKDLDTFLSTLQMEIVNTREIVSSLVHMGHAFGEMKEKLDDCEICLKQSVEQVSEIRAQCSIFNRIILTSDNEDRNQGIESYGNGDVFPQHAEIKMQTAEQQRQILRMLEKSLARELDLEKKLTESRQIEEALKFRLQEEVLSVEEEVEVFGERLFEAENFAEVLLGVSREVASRHQIVQFNLNGSVKREEGLRTKLQDLEKQLLAKESDRCKSENRCEELQNTLNLIEKKLKEPDFQLQDGKRSPSENQELNSKISEMDKLINEMKEEKSGAKLRAQTAESECKLLKDANMELNNELDLLKNSSNNTAEKLDLLERQLRETDIQLQHAVASAEASQEKETMLYSTIKDMENLIDDLKSKVSKAESHMENAEDKCIILSETNADLTEELRFLRGRMEGLEESLHQAKEAKKATSRDISARAKLITDLVMQLRLERERLQKKISLLKKDKKDYVKRWQRKDSIPKSTAGKENIKESVVYKDDFSSATSAKESEGALSATSDKGDISTNEAPSGKSKISCTDSTSKIDSVRDIDAGQLNFKIVLGVVLVILIPALVAVVFQQQSSSV